MAVDKAWARKAGLVILIAFSCVVAAAGMATVRRSTRVNRLISEPATTLAQAMPVSYSAERPVIPGDFERIWDTRQGNLIIGKSDPFLEPGQLLERPKSGQTDKRPPKENVVTVSKPAVSAEVQGQKTVKAQGQKTVKATKPTLPGERKPMLAQPTPEPPANNPDALVHRPQATPQQLDLLLTKGEGKGTVAKEPMKIKMAPPDAKQPYLELLDARRHEMYTNSDPWIGWTQAPPRLVKLTAKDEEPGGVRLVPSSETSAFLPSTPSLVPDSDSRPAAGSASEPSDISWPEIRLLGMAGSEGEWLALLEVDGKVHRVDPNWKLGDIHIISIGHGIVELERSGVTKSVGLDKQEGRSR